MRAIISFAFSPVAIALLNLPNDAASEEGAMEAVTNQNLVLPPNMSMTFSLANLPQERSGSNGTANCSTVSGSVWFLGGVYTSSSDETGSETQALQTLAEVPFSLAPGEVAPFSFHQPFDTDRTIVVATAIPPSQKHCLESSSATILDGGSGEFRGIVPNTVQRTEPPVIILDEPIGSGSCCACVPVCACGLCPD